MKLLSSMKKLWTWLGASVEKIYQFSILALFFGIVFYLTYLAACSTSTVSSNSNYVFGNEHSFYLKDNVLLNLFVAAGIFVIVLLCRKSPRICRFMEYINTDEPFFIKCRRFLLGILFLLSLVWVLATQVIPGSDQATVQNSVYAFHIEDYSTLSETGYLSMYQNQLGLVWLSYLLSFLFGSKNYLCFQLLNVFGIVLCYREASDIGGYFGMKRTSRLAVIATGILFFPLIMYCSFVYGTVLGLAFSMLAIEKLLAFLHTSKLPSAFLSAGAILLAMLLKSNYLIFWIGIFLHAAVAVIRQKKLRLVLLPILLLAALLIQSAVPTALARRVSGEALDQGASSWSWIAMGLQEGNMAPGWYNKYNKDSYIESGYNTAVQAEMAKADIQERIEYFLSDKRYTKLFFTHKIASQWNNPTFQSFWIIQMRSMNIKPADWVWYLTSENGEELCSRFLNLLQFVILAGTLGWCVLCRKRKEFFNSLIFALIFIGGFIFHLFWEAKGQYTICYFILLIPYAIEGYSTLADKIHLLTFEKGFTKKARLCLPPLLPFLCSAFVFLMLLHHLYSHKDYLTQDTEVYAQYLSDYGIAHALKEGTYTLWSNSNQGLFVSTKKDAETGEILLSEQASEIRIIYYQGVTWICIPSEKLYLTVSDTSDTEQQIVQAAAYTNKENQQWKTKAASDGGIYILYGSDYALTCSDGNVCVSSFTGSENQIWTAVKTD